MANRGEIARRVIRTCRDMTIETVAVYADPDAGEPHVMEADLAVRLAGSAPLETYLDIDAVLVAAAESGSDAVHPGYGFLSESPRFARAVIDAGIVWIGPPPGAIATMGSKLESKSIAAAAGVPVLMSTDLTGLSDEEMVSAAERIGFPVLVKASAGGGGKGMRIVRSPDDIAGAVAAAGREAGSAFGDDTVFLESFLDAPRHIEIQVVADSHGNVVSLHERECSIQRRHQKIIEEAPSVAIDTAIREEMGRAAIAIARTVEYLGAGTVEFLYQDGEFWFLEMNTRLQVEHPVTEMITGLDLVRVQIEVADGRPLPDAVLHPTVSGHAIEARLYAEDPAHDYLPVTGVVHQFSFPAADGLRIDSGVEAGSSISTHYDPMLAKVISHAPTREQAALSLANAIRRARIHGPITNRDLLVRVLEDQDFIAGSLDTQFLDDRDLTAPLVGEDEARQAVIAVAIADRAHRRLVAPVLSSIAGGWRNSSSPAHKSVYMQGVKEWVVEYHTTRDGVVVIDGADGVEIVLASPEKVELMVKGEPLEFDVHRVGSERYVDGPSGPMTLVELPRFQGTEVDEAPGSMHAPMPGRVVRVDVEVGDIVVEGQVLIVLEAMKMEHTLRAPTAGTVGSVHAAVGQQVEAGAVLAVVVEPSTSG